MDLEQVVYVVDENLLRLGNGIVAVRRDTARFSGPSARAWDQLVRLTTRWEAVARQVEIDGPWWLSLRRDRAVVMRYEPDAPERV